LALQKYRKKATPPKEMPLIVRNFVLFSLFNLLPRWHENPPKKFSSKVSVEAFDINQW
jgi:hypothetical protein